MKHKTKQSTVAVAHEKKLSTDRIWILAYGCWLPVSAIEQDESLYKVTFNTPAHAYETFKFFTGSNPIIIIT